MDSDRKAAEFAYGLSGLERDGNYDQLYRLMHPDATAIVPKSAVVGWYQEEFAPRNPQAITEITAVRQVEWTWPVTGMTYATTYEVDFVQPFGVGPAYTYVSETVRLVPAGNSFGWFFGRSREFVDEQIAHYGVDDSVASASSQNVNPAPANVVHTGGAACTVVELYPGYPGFRGNITGVMPHWNGHGDYECLETLQQNNPLFNSAQEDRANQQAADALGIHGPMNFWTWENWLLIETDRGLLPSCYTCLMLDTTTSPIRTDIHPEPDDYRILTGLMGQTTALQSIHRATGSSAGEIRLALEYGYREDYVLRALAYLGGGPTQNAQELYEEMQRWVQVATSPGGATGPVDPNEVLQIAIWERGGYTSVPDSAAPDDQVILMGYAFAVAEYATLDPNIRYTFGRLVEDWQLDRLQNPSTPLDTFIQQQPYGQQYRP